MQHGWLLPHVPRNSQRAEHSTRQSLHARCSQMTAVLGETPNALQAEGLDSDQTRAALLIAAGIPLGKVAEQVGVDRRTLYQWRQQPAFVAVLENELAVQVQLVRETVHARLLSLTERALDVVEDALNTDGSAALAAARVVLARVDAPNVKPLPSSAAMMQQAQAAQMRAEHAHVTAMSEAELVKRAREVYLQRTGRR